jgi:hypothetical protein
MYFKTSFFTLPLVNNLADCSLSRLSFLSSGLLGGSEVAGCWAESIASRANQQRNRKGAEIGVPRKECSVGGSGIAKMQACCCQRRN